MKIARIVIVVGTIIMICGIIFQYQGKGIVGPESSFMYHNKDWIDYGIGIIAFGIITTGIGVFYAIRR